MAMGLASMNPIPGAVKNSVVLIKPRPTVDEDKPKYGVTNDFSSRDYIALDGENKPSIRKTKELDETAVDVYIVRDEKASDIFNALVEMACDPSKNRPLEGNLYEVFTNHQQLMEDQPNYDSLLEKVYMDKTSKEFEGIANDVDNIKKHDRTMTSHKLNLDPMITDRGDLDGEGLCFPILAHVELDKAEEFFDSILSGKGETIVEG